VLFISRQQVQPFFIIVARQSQQAWIISQHFASPLVKLRHMPLSIISHWHKPMVRLQQQTSMPFIIMQQLTMPPINILARFCIMLQAIWSWQVQVIFMPPLHFSNFIMLQRGMVIIPGIMGLVPLIGSIPVPRVMPGMPIPVRPIVPIIMVTLLRIEPSSAERDIPGWPRREFRDARPG
jgi:hypothetical protein